MQRERNGAEKEEEEGKKRGVTGNLKLGAGV